MITLLDHIFF